MLQHRLLPWCHSHPLTEYNMTPKTLTTLNSHKPLCYSMCCDVISDSFLTGLAAVKTKRLSCVWMAEKRREGEMGGKLNLVPSCAVFTLALWGGRVKTRGGARRKLRALYFIRLLAEQVGLFRKLSAEEKVMMCLSKQT